MSGLRRLEQSLFFVILKYDVSFLLLIILLTLIIFLKFALNICSSGSTATSIEDLLIFFHKLNSNLFEQTCNKTIEFSQKILIFNISFRISLIIFN